MGIVCTAADEKKVVKAINTFLEKEHGFRKMKKNTNASMLEARLPHRMTHFYMQFLKQAPRWFFELYPNEDLDGNLKFAEFPECSWIVFINKMEYSDAETMGKIDRFFDAMMAAVEFETKVVKDYKRGEERL